MNCTTPFLDRVREAPTRPALCAPGPRITSFGALRDLVSKAQRVLRTAGVRPGDAVLLMDAPGPRAYAYIAGAIAMGSAVLLVDPWMPARHVQSVVELVSPTLFVAGCFGRGWGARVAAVRRIPRWVWPGELRRYTAGEVIAPDVADATPATITFTTGTTGTPKGIVRTHGTLRHQLGILARVLGADEVRGPDLVVFANLTLVNLAVGRTSIVMSKPWRRGAFRALAELPRWLRPESTTLGPALLRKLVREAGRQTLRAIHVGGAPAELDVIESGLTRWPDARWTHVYGSTEAEPVATADARVAVERSRARGWLQMAYVGRPIPEIEASVEPESLWLWGPHVCPPMLGDEDRLNALRRHDEQGRVWHCMADRVEERDGGWWYLGRSAQPAGDFEREQRVYARIGHTRALLHHGEGGRTVLVGEGVRRSRRELLRAFPFLDDVLDGRVVYDPRHRARIDRVRSTRGIR